MIRLENQQAKMIYTPRVELHGDDTEPGCTLNITIKSNNNIFDLLDENLKKTFYTEPPKDEQDLVDQVAEEGTNLTRLRFPMLNKKQSWSYETSGYRVVVGGGLTEENDLIFVQCDLNKFSFEVEEGGTVTLKFNINCDPNKEEAGRLYELNGSTIELTLEPPRPEDSAQMELDAA